MEIRKPFAKILKDIRKKLGKSQKKSRENSKLKKKTQNSRKNSITRGKNSRSRQIFPSNGTKPSVLLLKTHSSLVTH